MQTFLPYSNFHQSAKALDYRRLGKQRIETKQILNALMGKSKGWVNHPATQMWRGYETALAIYGGIICQEWIKRGYKDQQMQWFKQAFFELDGGAVVEYPSWLHDERFHASHRAALLAKDFEWYSQFEWTEEPKICYYWPKGKDNENLES